jgi:hypothetical protein
LIGVTVGCRHVALRGIVHFRFALCVMVIKSGLLYALHVGLAICETVK